MAQTEFPQSFSSYNMYYDNQDAPPSRLPRPTPKRGGQGGHRPGYTQPSKLEMLQSDYQKKLLREKEAKLIEMYERQQEMAIRKVSGNSSKRGIVRDFFEERRAMERQGNSNAMPSMAAHFKNKKRERDRAVMQQQEQRKTSAGRANRLAPLDHRNNPARGYAPTNYANNDLSSHENDKTPTPPISRKPRLVRNHRTKQSPVNYYDNTPPYSDDDAPPPKSTLKNLHDKKRKAQKGDRQKDKLSDFQKWQMEQNMQRQKRLEKLKKKQDILPDSEEEENFDVHQEPPRKEPPRKEPPRKELPKSEVQTVIYNKIRQKELELQKMIEEQQLEEEQQRAEEERELEERRWKQQQRLREERLRRAKQEEERMERERQERERQAIQDDDPYIVDFEEEPKIEPVRHPKPKPKKTVKRPPPPPQPPKEPEEDDYYSNREKDNFYETVEDDSEVNLDLRPCPSCGRKFNSDRLAKHAKVCKQNTNKKRKVFDTTKHRTEGTEMAQYVRQGKHLEEGPKPKASSWRKKHEDFQQSIKQARMYQDHIAKGGKASDLPPPPPSVNPDYKQCPYCKRRFNPDAADRHIPKCKDIKNRPPPPKRR
ncbi:zinc finger C2HC domain-containing protein 1C-like [Ptychodera flava]|uniref:zinc finger C2HC domain-containing protein 1C-like n=1 Tax=Ptychodera flava TaxID=63121 RepID=UPI003969C703